MTKRQNKNSRTTSRSSIWRAAVAVLIMLSSYAHSAENSSADSTSSRTPSKLTAGKPLKIYILAGQSNMEGQARVSTIERLNLTEDSKEMYKDMIGDDGKPTKVKDAYCVAFGGRKVFKIFYQGPLTPGYGKDVTPGTRFGPEITFGIHLKKHLNEPFLIIKTAWGGASLIQQFRPPSAAPYISEKDHKGYKTGYYYGLMMKGIEQVLNDPGKFHPGYDKTAGYELAGVVWFQGYNDMINSYYQTNRVEGKDMFFQYTDLLCTFIRDVRKDLKSPKLPFVIGAVGIGGPIEDTGKWQYWLRKAQLAPASVPEFKGNVIAVRTENCWDTEWDRVQKKWTQASKEAALAARPELKDDAKALSKLAKTLKKTKASELLTPSELKLTRIGKTDGSYHYLGSAYTYGKIGKVFAESMLNVSK